MISHRYERGSTIITSIKSIREWPDMLVGDEVLATAILDRLLHHCHVIQIDGRSFRLRDMGQKLDEPLGQGRPSPPWPSKWVNYHPTPLNPVTRGCANLDVI